jgi:hypothetical protein
VNAMNNLSPMMVSANPLIQHGSMQAGNDPRAEPSPNMVEASRFLSILAGNESVTFQTFDDTADKRKWLAKVMHGSLSHVQEQLHQLNDQGAGVFFMVNQGDGHGRRTANVKAIRAVFVDLDGAPLDPVENAAIKPNIIVESSPGRWHAYWLIDDLPLSEFSNVQSQLASIFNGDPAVKDLPRVMRIPGFIHHKNGAHASKLIAIRDNTKITREQFYAAFDIHPIIPIGVRNAHLFNSASGFKHGGISKAGARRRVERINEKQCAQPLDSYELDDIIDNAYCYPTEGFSMIPHALIDTPEFTYLSGGAAKLLLYAYRRHRPHQAFSLPHSDFSHIPVLKNRQSFAAAREELIQAGILVRTRNYVAGVALQSRLCALYVLSDRVQVERKKYDQ